MPDDAIAAMAERLATLCVGLSRNIPQWILDSEVVPSWVTLSVATTYLSFAKHWLPFFPAPDVARAVDRQMDDCFFDFVEYTDFEVKVSDVIIHPTERDLYCGWINSVFSTPVVRFEQEVITSKTLLNVLFANRCNQYTADLKEGIAMGLEGKPSVVGPIIFVYKRFNQHVYGIDCDERTIDLDERFKHLAAFPDLFMGALVAVSQCFFDSIKQLPFSL
jgi:hypothetical protein